VGLAGFNRMRRLKAEEAKIAKEEVKQELEEEIMDDDELFDIDDEDTEMQKEKLAGKRKKKR
jgi:hypothetical protein